MDTNAFKNKFRETFGNEAMVYFAPGRVNIIGEHTDYNGGFVLPSAISFGTFLAIAPNNKGTINLQTTNFDYKAEIPLGDLSIKHGDEWVNYPLGVIDQFVHKGITINKGIDMLFSGDIPNGAGLSSSASIELVTAVALNDFFKAGYNRLDLIKMSQLAENVFVGMQCGIMDQFAVGMGKVNSALFLNCRTLEYELVPLDLNEHSIVIMNTNKRRELADSKYNERVAECAAALEALRTKKEMIDLSDITVAEFNEIGDVITDPVIYRRARHVITENNRVTLAVAALKRGDLVTLGQLMNDSHESLRHDYQVTGAELDTIVNAARKVKGVLGARMTGAGFGGCAIAIVDNRYVEALINKVGLAYEAEIGLKPIFYVARVGNGAGLVT
ncbi:MAG: galactokinase [Chloroflexota bacterium]|nr:galactokinase [Lentimicrobium sp.]